MTNDKLDPTEVILRFNEAFQRHDPAALAPLVGVWRYRWQGGSVRGVNVMKVEDGLIVEARGYVKGGG